MPKRLDVNQIAAKIIHQTTKSYSPPAEEKNPAAVALGRLGGLKGGKARAASLSKRRKAAIAKKAALARWKDHKRAKS
jgi:hypothetical protein